MKRPGQSDQSGVASRIKVAFTKRVTTNKQRRPKRQQARVVRRWSNSTQGHCQARQMVVIVIQGKFFFVPFARVVAMLAPWSRPIGTSMPEEISTRLAPLVAGSDQKYSVDGAGAAARYGAA